MVIYFPLLSLLIYLKYLSYIGNSLIFNDMTFIIAFYL